MKLTTLVALLAAIAVPAAAQPLEPPTFVCRDQQAADTAAALARLGDRESLAIHSRSFGCVVVVPLDEFTADARLRDRYRLHRRPEAE